MKDPKSIRKRIQASQTLPITNDRQWERYCKKFGLIDVQISFGTKNVLKSLAIASKKYTDFSHNVLDPLRRV